MRQSIKYDAEFFRKMNSAKELQEDVELKKQYSELLERMKEHVSQSPEIITSYQPQKVLTAKLVFLLESDGFKVEYIEGLSDWFHKISW